MAKVQLKNGKVFSSKSGESLLDAATNAGIALPYSCKTGRCSSCKCKVLSGETFPLTSETGLSDAEKVEGWILSCVRTATSDVTLEVEDLGDLTLPPVKTQPCRISSIEKVAPDVIKVVLRLPPNAVIDFIPGQYIEVIGPGGVRRSYSLANAPRSDNTLELHIRKVEGGVMSQFWFDHAAVNDLLRLRGPQGTFFLRDAAQRDLIFLATGTGIAPVKAMLEILPSFSTNQQPKSVTVLWGGRQEQDLYFDVASLCGHHRYIPVLSRAGENWLGERGYIQDALLRQQPDFNNCSVYACGSDAMIHSANTALTTAGLSRNRFYSDAFVCSGL